MFDFLKHAIMWNSCACRKATASNEQFGTSGRKRWRKKAIRK